MIQIEDKAKLLAHSAHAGLYLGLFFILKYFCVFYTLRFPLLGVLYMLLTAAVPFVVYRQIRSYRNRIVSPQSRFSVFHGWQYGMSLFIFASVLVSVSHYYYHAFLLPSQMTAFSAQIEQTLRQPGMRELMLQITGGKDWNTILQEFLAIKPISRVWNDISMNVFWGAIVSVICALILRRPAPEVANEN